ncbi:MAG: GMC family oxidoreductase, partial [Bacteroidota bacterium]|nr:GMC family oxidoreductase [Candidatus Kapabacteria bacterium]MDW8221164.1 GMC family oxidoreductase [Bacteroidota bacterium]
SLHNPQNQALERGALALGYHTSVIPRNTHGCIADGCRMCGYCSLGCQRGTKMSVVKAYLERAYVRGARFLVETQVEKIHIRRGMAIGVEAYHRGKVVTVHAKIVVIAAGALHTPALLLRSGIQHPHIGKHLHLHPTVAVAGVYPEPMHPWHGGMMTVVLSEHARLNGTWGFRLETPPIHSGLLAMALPWRSGKAHKHGMLKAAHIGAYIVLTRDRDGGSITLNKRGRPIAQYRVSAFDLAHLQRGIQEAARIHWQAGATELYLPHNHCEPVSLREGGLPALERVLSALPSWRWRPNDYPLFSAHQMGTCRMGGFRDTHPVSPEGELYSVRHLFIADTSAFPEASGVNPMLSVQALAHYIAQSIKARYTSG